MTNNSGRRRRNRQPRRRNPLTVSARIPRPKVGFNGNLFSATTFTAPMVTIANGAVAMYPLDCSGVKSIVGGLANFYIQSVAYDFQGFTGAYNEFVYRSVTFEWLPYISPGVADAGSQIYIAYVDNAEAISQSVASPSVSLSFATTKNARNMRFFNAWERFRYTVPISSRHKSFDTNFGTVYSDVNVVDRSVQGVVFVGSTSNTAAVSLGQWRITYNLELRNLNTNVGVLT